MYHKTPSFFSRSSGSITKMSEVDALNEVKKIIEAQLAFNRLLALQVLQSSDTECLQIEASFYLNLEEIPSPPSPRPDSFNAEYMKELRKRLAKMILSDVVGYEKLSTIANAGKELDYLYLHVHFFREEMICGLKQTDYGFIKNIMSSFFSGTVLDSKTKKIRKEISNLRLKSPLTTDIDMLKEILQILKPKISSYCERFVGEIPLEEKGGSMFSVLKGEVIRNRRKINEKVSTLRKNNSQDQELISLSEQYFDAARNTYPNQVSNDSCTEYLNSFDRFKKEYQHEEQLRRKMAELSRPPVKTLPQSPSARSKEKPPLKSVKQKTDQETVPSPAVNTTMPPEILTTPSMAFIVEEEHLAITITTRARKKLSNEAQLRDILLSQIPKGCTLGEAYEHGDCFFDALAQRLNAINQTDANTDESLRGLCYDFYLNNKALVDKWSESESKAMDNKNNYARVKYTAAECQRDHNEAAPIWGSWMEGLILCRQLNLDGICVIEICKDSVSEQPAISFYLATKENYKNINNEEAQAWISNPKIPTLVVEQKSLHFVPLLMANQYNETLSTTPLNENLVALRPKNSITLTPELVTTTEEKEVAEDYSYSPFNKPKTVAPKNVVPDNKLRFAEAYPDFGKEEAETFLKVFGLMEYTSISLRGLLNLVLAFKGTITSTGANRCRMEIKNIYAYVLMTEQTLQDLFGCNRILMLNPESGCDPNSKGDNISTLYLKKIGNTASAWYRGKKLTSYDIELREVISYVEQHGKVVEDGTEITVSTSSISTFQELTSKCGYTPCQKATMTMHGAAHHKNRSQNHDRGEAPSYLINQFQSAFKRAGFTPENLSLDAACCHEKRMK